MLRSVEPREYAARILPALRMHVDPVRAEKELRYFKGAIRNIGVTAPNIRLVERELFAAVRGLWGPDEAVELCEMVLPERLFEPTAVALITLARFAKRLGPDAFDRCETWLARDYCDNWASTDTLCPHVVGPIVDQYAELLPRLVAWARDSNPWLRRGASVSLVKPAGKGRHLDAAYAVAERLLDERDDLVQKGAGWMLRECGKADSARLENWLHRWGPRVPRTTLRYAIEKFPDRERRRLLTGTKGR